MNIIYLNSFYKDLKKIKDVQIKQNIKTIILQIKELEKLEDLNSVKKLKGYSVAYRIKVKNYRLGIYKTNETTIELVRLIKREDIYKVFPKKK